MSSLEQQDMRVKPADVMDTFGCNSNKMVSGEAGHPFWTIGFPDVLFGRLRGHMVTENPDNDRVNQLIAEKQYEEAKTLLRQSNDPEARAWLAKLEQTFPTTSLKRPTSSYESSGSGTTGNNTSGSAGCTGALGLLGTIVSSILTCLNATPETRLIMVGAIAVVVVIFLLLAIFKQSD